MVRRKKPPLESSGRPADRGWSRLEAEAAYAKSIVLHSLGDAQASIAAAERSLAALPTYAPAILCVGSIEYQRKNRSRGRDLFRSLLDLPDGTADLEPIIDRAGEFLIDFKAHQDGLALYRHASKRFPANAAFEQGRGCCAGHLGLHDEAIDASRAALAIEPGNQKFVNDLGWSLFEAGRIEEALTTLERAAAMDPDDRLASENLRICRKASAKSPRPPRQPGTRTRKSKVSPDAGLSEYFDFEVSLCGVEPRIWRRFLILTDVDFADLHHALQDACGWENDHLYEFRDPRTREAIGGSPGLLDEPATDLNAWDVPLSRWFRRGVRRKFVYLYDFGDSWRHELVLKGVVRLRERFSRRLLAGARAFPREDCGGVTGYWECVAAFRNRGSSETDPATAIDDGTYWTRGFDPELFDLEACRAKFDISLPEPKKARHAPKPRRGRMAAAPEPTSDSGAETDAEA